VLTSYPYWSGPSFELEGKLYEYLAELQEDIERMKK
jgi:hypothetical protein